MYLKIIVSLQIVIMKVIDKQISLPIIVYELAWNVFIEVEYNVNLIVFFFASYYVTFYNRFICDNYFYLLQVKTRTA